MFYDRRNIGIWTNIQRICIPRCFLCRLCKIRELQSEKLYAKEFQYEGLLKEKLRRQTEINSQLEIKEEEEVVMAEEMEETIAPPQAATIAR